MASNVPVKPNARGLLLLAGAADSLAARRDDEVINDFRVRTVQKRNHSDFCFTVCHAPFAIYYNSSSPTKVLLATNLPPTPAANSCC